MKKSLIVLLLIIQVQHGWAQCDEDKPLLTSPAAPVNTDLNPRLKPVTGAVNEFKNSFNWGAYDQNGFLPIALNPDMDWEGIP
jgi:hypothetical protein